MAKQKLPTLGLLYMDYVLRFFDKSNFKGWPDKIETVTYHWKNDKTRFINEVRRKNIDVLVREAKLEYFGPVAQGGIVAIYTKKPIEIPFGTRIDMAGFHQPRGIIQNGMPAELISNSFPIIGY